VDARGEPIREGKNFIPSLSGDESGVDGIVIGRQRLNENKILLDGKLFWTMM
jgi:hypothetical protein